MQNLVTFIGRVQDGMLLVATMDTAFELDELMRNTKRLLKTLKTDSPARCTIEAGPCYYHYIIEEGVCYLTLTERNYPKRLAFQYLEELQQEFSKDFGPLVHTFSKPYAAVEFDPKMNRIRRQFVDPRCPKNVEKLDGDLTQIHNIMVANIEEVLQRGEKLENIHRMSSTLVEDSKKFEKYSRYVNWQYLIRTIGPLVAIALVLMGLAYYKFFR